LHVTFNELAERELIDAAAYYEVEQPGLGEAFIRTVEQCTAAIAALPSAGTPSGVASVSDSLTYALLYKATDTEIRNLAVMNLRRRPGACSLIAAPF